MGGNNRSFKLKRMHIIKSISPTNNVGMLNNSSFVSPNSNSRNNIFGINSSLNILEKDGSVSIHDQHRSI